MDGLRCCAPTNSAAVGPTPSASPERPERAGWLAELRASRLRAQLGVELLSWAEQCGVGLVLDEGTPLRFAIPPEQVQAYRVAAEYTGIAASRSLGPTEGLQRSA